MKLDIKNKSDIEIIVNHFYNTILKTDGIKDFFGGVVPIDWQHHLPIMIGFWDFIIFDTKDSYSGNVMNPHLKLNKIKTIEPINFDQWINVFNQTVDSLFEGPNADKMKNSAFNIGMTMKYKIKKENAVE